MEKNIPEIDKKISFLNEKWNDILKNNKKEGLFSKVDLSIISSFILFSLDELVTTIDGLLSDGSEKKIIVLQSIEKIYDHIVKEGLPVWAKPIAKNIKYYIVYIIISSTIDYFVFKYRNKDWKNENSKPTPKPTPTLISNEPSVSYKDYYIRAKKSSCEENQNYESKSTSSNELHNLTANKIFIIDKNLDWKENFSVKCICDKDNYLEAKIISYNESTGELVVAPTFSTSNKNPGTVFDSWEIIVTLNFVVTSSKELKKYDNVLLYSMKNERWMRRWMHTKNIYEKDLIGCYEIKSITAATPNQIADFGAYVYENCANCISELEKLSSKTKGENNVK